MVQQKDLPILSQRTVRLILLAAFALTHLIIWKIQGVVYVDEAAKYIRIATSLYEQGKFGDQKFIVYLPVILLIYCCKLLQLPLFVAILIQTVFAGMALLKFYSIACEIGSKKTGFIAAIFLATCIPIHRWNLTLYSESIFISLLIFFLGFVYKYRHDLYSKKYWIIAFSVLLSFSRPHGLLFIPSILIYLFLNASDIKKRIRILLLSIIMIASLFALALFIFEGGGGMDAMKPFKESHVICYIPTKEKMPALDIVETGSVYNDLLYYITHNKVHFIKLTALKLKSFFLITRTHYSTVQNTYLTVLILILYPFTLFGIFRVVTTKNPFLLYLLVTLIIYPLACTLQCDDWHARFTVPILPHIILIASFGLHQLTIKSCKNNNEL